MASLAVACVFNQLHRPNDAPAFCNTNCSVSGWPIIAQTIIQVELIRFSREMRRLSSLATFRMRQSKYLSFTCAFKPFYPHRLRNCEHIRDTLCLLLSSQQPRACSKSTKSPKKPRNFPLPCLTADDCTWNNIAQKYKTKISDALTGFQ